MQPRTKPDLRNIRLTDLQQRTSTNKVTRSAQNNDGPTILLLLILYCKYHTRSSIPVLPTAFKTFNVRPPPSSHPALACRCAFRCVLCRQSDLIYTSISAAKHETITYKQQPKMLLASLRGRQTTHEAKKHHSPLIYCSRKKLLSSQDDAVLQPHGQSTAPTNPSGLRRPRDTLSTFKSRANNKTMLY